MAENAGEAQIRPYKLPAKHTHGLAFKKPPSLQLRIQGCLLQIERHETCSTAPFSIIFLYFGPLPSK